jgi:SNF2 family DNA or RNA helicase
MPNSPFLLDLIAEALSFEGHTFTSIEGTMTLEQRESAMANFSTTEGQDSCRFILCSLRACGTGINLTAGNHVFMVGQDKTNHNDSCPGASSMPN